MSSKLKTIIELAKASTATTIELECFITPDKARGIQDFSMCDMTVKQNTESRPKEPEVFHGVVPLDWLAIWSNGHSKTAILIKPNKYFQN